MVSLLPPHAHGLALRLCCLRLRQVWSSAARMILRYSLAYFSSYNRRMDLPSFSELADVVRRSFHGSTAHSVVLLPFVVRRLIPSSTTSCRCDRCCSSKQMKAKGEVAYPACSRCASEWCDANCSVGQLLLACDGAASEIRTKVNSAFGSDASGFHALPPTKKEGTAKLEREQCHEEGANLSQHADLGFCIKLFRAVRSCLLTLHVHYRCISDPHDLDCLFLIPTCKPSGFRKNPSRVSSLSWYSSNS